MYGTVTALRTCSALVVPATGSYAARVNVPDTEGLAPVPRAEQSAYAVVAAARRARRDEAMAAEVAAGRRGRDYEEAESGLDW